MTLLVDKDILKEIDMGMFKISHFDPDLVQPASIDVRLANRFVTFRVPPGDGAIDPAIYQSGLAVPCEREDSDPFLLYPGQFALGATFERFTIPGDLAGRIEGKSSLGRLGLMVHSTAGFIDPGFAGHITLELSNINLAPIKLWPGMLIAQLALYRTTGVVDKPYGRPSLGSHYQYQSGGPVPSKSYVGFRRGLLRVVVGSYADPADRESQHPMIPCRRLP